MYNIHENEVAKLCPHKPTDSVKIFESYADYQ